MVWTNMYENNQNLAALAYIFLGKDLTARISPCLCTTFPEIDSILCVIFTNSIQIYKYTFTNIFWYNVFRNTFSKITSNSFKVWFSFRRSDQRSRNYFWVTIAFTFFPTSNRLFSVSLLSSLKFLNGIFKFFF